MSRSSPSHSPLSCRTSPPQGGRFAAPASAVSQSPPLRGRCPAGQRGVRRNAIVVLMSAILSLLTIFLLPASADEATLRPIIAKLATAKGFPATEAIVRELVASGDPAVEKPLLALSDGDLYFRKSDSAV